jgi:hypothetical protein
MPSVLTNANWVTGPKNRCRRSFRAAGNRLWGRSPCRRIRRGFLGPGPKKSLLTFQLLWRPVELTGYITLRCLHMGLHRWGGLDRGMQKVMYGPPWHLGWHCVVSFLTRRLISAVGPNDQRLALEARLFSACVRPASSFEPGSLLKEISAIVGAICLEWSLWSWSSHTRAARGRGNPCSGASVTDSAVGDLAQAHVTNPLRGCRYWA